MEDFQANILVVDDVLENLRLLINMLTEHGYTVRPANSGHAALMTVSAEAPDLILLDIQMPGMNGYEVCEQLKANEQTHDIPVIFISALDELFDKVKAFGVGGVDYITKPFQVDEVLARIRTHLTIRQLQYDLQSANETLEEKVQARTAALAEANKQLKVEIESRIQHQQEKDRLFTAVSQQSEQLRTMTNWLIESRQQTDGTTMNMHREIQQDISLVHSNMDIIRSLFSPDQSPIISNHLDTIQQVIEKVEKHVQQATSNMQETTDTTYDLTTSPLLTLTTREREVLQLMTQGKTNNEIADILALSLSTVYTYNNRIKQKLDMDSVPELIKFAMEHKLLG